MSAIARIEQRRSEILEQMGAIRSMERGTLKEQMLKVKHKGETQSVLRGPYYVLAKWSNGKTKSRRVKGDELACLKEDVGNHKRFVALCREFEDLTEQLGQLERAENGAEMALKKGLKSRSSKVRKSRES